MYDPHENIVAIRPASSDEVFNFTQVPYGQVWRRDFWDPMGFEKAMLFIQHHRAIIAGGAVRYTVSPKLMPAPAEDIDIFVEGNIAPHQLKSFFNGRVVSSIRLDDNGSPSNRFSVHTVIRQPNGANIQVVEQGFPPYPPLTAAFPLATFDFSVTRVGLYSTQMFPMASYQKTPAVLEVRKAALSPDSFNRVMCTYETSSPNDNRSDFFRDEAQSWLVPRRDVFNLKLVGRIWKYVKLGYRLHDEDAIVLLTHLRGAPFAQARLGHAALAQYRQVNDVLSTLFCEGYQDYMNQTFS